MRRDSRAQLAAAFLPAGGAAATTRVIGSKRSAGGQPQKFPGTTVCPAGMVKTGSGQEWAPVGPADPSPRKPYVLCRPVPVSAAPAAAPATTRIEVSPTFQQQFTPSISPTFQQVSDSPGASVGATTTQAGAGSQETGPPRTTMPVIQPGVSSHELLAILSERDDARRREEASARSDIDALKRSAAAAPSVTIQPVGPPVFFAPTAASADVVEGELVEASELPLGVMLAGVVAIGGVLFFMQQRKRR